MTDDTPNPTAPEAAPDAAAGVPGGADPDTPASAIPEATSATPPPADAQARSSADGRARRPEYRGAELDPERGPGLGCFWFQVIVLAFFIVLIPIGISLAWPYELLAILLFVVIGLLLLTGQSVIFLLRLVAADRRAQGRRRPLASATRTVGELEDQRKVAHAVGSAEPAPTVAAGPGAAPIQGDGTPPDPHGEPAEPGVDTTGGAADDDMTGGAADYEGNATGAAADEQGADGASGEAPDDDMTGKPTETAASPDGPPHGGAPGSVDPAAEVPDQAGEEPDPGVRQ